MVIKTIKGDTKSPSFEPLVGAEMGMVINQLDDWYQIGIIVMPFQYVKLVLHS